MSIIKSLLHILDSRAIKMSDLCTYLGINTSTMANWKTRETDPPAKYIAPICEFLDISTDYLLIGKEKSSLTELTADEQELLTYYKKLPKEQQYKTLGRLEALVEMSVPEPVTEIASKTIYIEMYSLPVSAGDGVYLDGHDKDMIEVECTPLTSRANFALTVKGDSMEPMYFDGDIILIQSQPCVEVDEIGIFILNDEGYVKMFGDDRLISLNPKYEDILIHDYDSFYCKGKVIGKL